MPTLSSVEQHRTYTRIASRIAVIYACCGVAWIIGSDLVLDWIVTPPERLTLLQMTKGWFYVGITSLLLYVLISRYLQTLEVRETELRDSEQRHRTLAESRRSLINELDHRVKNNLAMLYSLVSIEAKSARNIECLAQAIRRRIMTMKRVHELLAVANWEAVEMARLARELFGQTGRGDASPMPGTYEGPNMLLTPKQACTLAMIFDEISSLGISDAAPRPARFTWRIITDPGRPTMVELVWVYPDALEPTCDQSALIEGLSQFDLAGECGFSRGDCGLEFTLRFPLMIVEPAGQLRANAAAAA